MVASLIASGAYAGAVTDPSSQDPFGTTSASIASSCSHKGVAEKTISSISTTSPVTHEDQLSLKDTLDAVRNAAQAAARIQSAFRAHSFRKRRLREAASAATTCGDEYCIFSNLAFRNMRDYNSAALSIRRNIGDGKAGKTSLHFARKLMYEDIRLERNTRYVGVLEKVLLRWRGRGVGLRGFRLEEEPVEDSEDEVILKLFCKQKVDAAINEAVSRVLSMVDSPEAGQQYHRILEKYRQAKVSEASI
ncbi:hypothetical protein K7X08_025815 [Anisodus acutangulus]|uniref:Uncharacterized protein n=1 Tax=Anisodus acutangulus TaxID=402998 RepID=A0A9Q1QX33_9SOLA|nr:hypothetical protein K7X08_025815 [Anisodus acutangulus]